MPWVMEGMSVEEMAVKISEMSNYWGNDRQ